MQKTKSAAGEAAEKPKGKRALLGAAMAIIGAVAAANPASTLLVTLAEVVPQLAVALPPVITAVGALIAALSDPPRMAREK
jgi:hypothetical protein